MTTGTHRCCLPSQLIIVSREPVSFGGDDDPAGLELMSQTRVKIRRHDAGGGAKRGDVDRGQLSAEGREGDDVRCDIRSPTERTMNSRINIPVAALDDEVGSRPGAALTHPANAAARAPAAWLTDTLA